MCNCAKTGKKIINTSFTEVLSTEQIYKLLTDEQKLEFVQATYLGRPSNHLIPIKSERAVEIGLKNYGVGRYGFIIWVHQDEIENENPLFAALEIPRSVENVEEVLDESNIVTEKTVTPKTKSKRKTNFIRG